MAGNYSLGDAEGTIRIKYDNKGVREASTDVQSLGDRAKGTQQRFSSLAATTGIAAGAMAAGLGLAVNAAIDFEKRISAIGAVSGATADQLETIRKKALQLGADTAFSASEAALAMEELVKSGLSVEDVMNGAADATVALAAAGEVDLPQAASIAANAMNQFNLVAKDLPRIADLIAGAANASAIDVSEFGFAMQQAGAVANLVGLNFDDLAAAIALMGNAGIKGSDAGTSLKTMLQNLQPTTKRQIELAKELGIVTKDGSNRFFDQHGQLKSLADVAGILNTSLKGMTDQQKALALETLFGSDAIRAAAILTNEGADGFRNMASAMGEVSAEGVAAERLNNTAGAIEQLKGSVETAAIALGTALLPVIRKVTEFVTKLVNWFSALDPKWQQLIAFAAVAVTGLIALIAVIAGVVAAVAGVVAAFAGVGEIVAIIVGVIAGVIAFAAAIKTAYQQSEQFRAFVAKLGQVAKGVFDAIMAVVKPLAAWFQDKLIPAVKEIAQKLKENLQPAFKAVSEFISSRILPAIDKLKGAFEKVMPTIISVGNVILTVAKFIFNILGKALGFLIPLLLKIIGPIFSVLIDVISGVISFIPTLVEWFKKFVGILITVGKIIGIAIIAPFYLLYQVGKWVFEQIMKAVDVFVAGFMAVWNFLWPVIKVVFDLIVAIIGVAFAIIAGIFQVAWTIIKAIWDVLWAYVIKPVVNAFKVIVDAIGGALSWIWDKIQAAWADIKAIWDKVYGWIVPPIVNAFNKIRDFIAEKMALVRDKVSEIWDKIVGFFSGAKDRLVKAISGFTDFVNKVRDYFTQMKDKAVAKAEELIAWVKGLPKKIADTLGNLANTLKESGRALIQGFWDGIKDIWNKMAGWVETQMGKLRDLWPFSPAKRGPFSGKGWVLYSGQALMEGFAQGIDQRAGLVSNTAQDAMRAVATQLPVDHSANVRAGQAMAMSVPSAGGVSSSSTTSTSTYGDVTLNVSLDDLKTVKDLEELWEWIDNLRNNTRRGLEVTTA